MEKSKEEELVEQEEQERRKIVSSMAVSENATASGRSHLMGAGYDEYSLFDLFLGFLDV